MSRKSAPYGTWESPISAESISVASKDVVDVLVDSITGAFYHIERRPSEQGRRFLVSTRSGRDVILQGSGSWNVKTGVHEYGGGAAVVRNGLFYFSNYADGRVYKVEEEGIPEPVTPINAAHRFASFTHHPIYPQLLVSILEDYTDPSIIQDSLVCINTKTTAIAPLTYGADFYASPTFSPDGKHLAWIQWFHPDMPWEGGEIYIADVFVTDLSMTVENLKHIAGKKGEISASHPSWVSDDILLFTSDDTGYQNPWTYTLSSNATNLLLPSPMPVDFSPPAWHLGSSFSAVLPSREKGTKVLFAAVKEGRCTLFLVDNNAKVHELQCPYVRISCLRLVHWDADKMCAELVLVGAKVDETESVIRGHIHFGEDEAAQNLSLVPLTATTSLFPKEFISVPQPMTLRTSADNPVHVLFYAPRNPHYEGSNLPGEKPPCVVEIHGGPTDMAHQGLNWKTQYFTSRGWAFLLVNYGGSSGYGRKYMNRLVGNWGIVDVQDAIDAARILSAPDALLDPSRIVIRGASAGGYTALAAFSLPLSQSDRTVFAAGAASYGISDLKGFGADTHKFESHYPTKLIGGSLGDVPELCRQRSVIENVSKIERPLLIMHGDGDRVVPYQQSERLVEAIKRQGGTAQYHLFSGEGHGWQKSDTIRDALEIERAFYELTLRLR